MPRVEETLAVYLSPDAASFLKAPTLSNKPCLPTSSLVGKAYMVAGQAGTCLHSMANLQAFKANLQKDLDKSKGLRPDDIKELRWATDLSLCATKETARAIGYFMAALVVMERHLW